MNRILHLNLYKKYFDEIANGTKTIEYRDKTDYWKKRIENKEYDVIKFRNGYAKNAPTMLVEYKGYSVGKEYELKLFHINMDKPDGKRKLHKKPVPLAGGAIIFLNLTLYFIFISNNQNLLFNEIIFKNYENFVLFFVISFFIFSLGFMDDRFNISALMKFFIISIA